jgi:acylphosphatase
MKQPASLHVIVYGLVQGVYFRAFVTEQAFQTGLTGYVVNLPGGRSVEVVAEGEKELLEILLEKLKTGPPAARVEKISAEWGEFSGGYVQFMTKY